jgi:hypothetical protein
LVLYKVYKKLEINKLNLLIVTAVFLEINIISFALRAADNAGRYFYISSAMLIIFLAIELSPVIRSQISIEGK